MASTTSLSAKFLLKVLARADLKKFCLQTIFQKNGDGAAASSPFCFSEDRKRDPFLDRSVAMFELLA